MTTPAFTHLITFDTTSPAEVGHPMSDSSLSLEHHLIELRQLAMDLHNERSVAAPPAPRRPNRLRMAIGSMLLSAGSALVDGPSRRSTQAR